MLSGVALSENAYPMRQLGADVRSVSVPNICRNISENDRHERGIAERILKSNAFFISAPSSLVGRRDGLQHLWKQLHSPWEEQEDLQRFDWIGLNGMIIPEAPLWPGPGGIP